MLYLDVYSTSKNSSTCNCRAIVKYFHLVTLNNMTYVNLGANAYCISTNTLDEIVVPWDLWLVMADANASGKVDL